jgi:hypothetical protein
MNSIAGFNAKLAKSIQSSGAGVYQDSWQTSMFFIKKKVNYNGVVLHCKGDWVNIGIDGDLEKLTCLPGQIECHRSSDCCVERIDLATHGQPQ